MELLVRLELGADRNVERSEVDVCVSVFEIGPAQCHANEDT